MNMDLTGEKTPLVLVVDDDELIRLLARETLEQAGFTVAEVDSGEQAVAAFARLLPDIVLLDVMLPGKDGFTVCAEIRECQGGDDTQILMMTGLDDIESIRRAYDVGGTDFITKPINWLILGYRIRYMLRASLAVSTLRQNEARFATVQRIAHIGSWEWNIQKDELYCSEELFRIFTVEAIGFDANYQSFLNSVHPLDREFVSMSIEEALFARKPYNIDYRILLPGGIERIVHAEAEVTWNDEGKPVWMAGIIQDITERKRAEEQIYNLAYFDSLTGLPNRLLFKEHLAHALAHSTRTRKVAAILFLDLDRFKQINDTLGHSIGDKLLQKVAECLVVCVRKCDTISRVGAEDFPSSVSRLGGDEFTVLLTDIASVQDAARVALRIINTVSQPMNLDGHEVIITTSIGISLYPDDGNDVITLIKNADTAMYHAKDQGRNNFQFYNRSMNSTAYERLVLENHLRRALEREEFLLHYQPQYDIASGEIIGVEALIRWRHPDLGMVSPGVFIPLAEETGLVIQIDEWVIRNACAQGKAWRESGLPPVPMAVNLSGQNFIRKNLLETISRVLDETGLDPRLLELELTESVLMKNAREAAQTLKALKEMGLNIAIDDFGTGYSSLSYLMRFPLDTLKIDQSFIREIPADSDSTAIIRAIIALAHSLKLRVVAEGVETETQLDFLRANGCNALQGFLFSRPLPAAEVARLIREKKAA
ncbi:MAG TPA: EAL domain-containing protein [Geobacteraceae bacterium]|nr:EAL domain-containing protein [Geobacteraceae bacterium]